MSGMARAAVSLHGKNPIQRSSRDTQPPGNRNVVFHILVHSTPADDQGMGAPYVPRERCHSRTAEDTKAGRWGKSPPHRQGGSSGPPAPYQYPAHRSMRRSDRPKVVSLVQPPFLSDLRKARFRPTPPPLPPGRGTALENLYPRRLSGKKHNREKSVKGASGTACGGVALD